MGRTRGGCQSKIADDGGVFGDEDIFAERRFFCGEICQAALPVCSRGEFNRRLAGYEKQKN